MVVRAFFVLSAIIFFYAVQDTKRCCPEIIEKSSFIRPNTGYSLNVDLIVGRGPNSKSPSERACTNFDHGYT